MNKPVLVSPEVRAARGRVLDEREAKASLFIPDPPISTLIGRVPRIDLDLSMAFDAETGLPTIADGAVTSAAAEPERTTIPLDVSTHREKPRGLKK